MIGECLNVFFRHACVVVDHHVVHWESCCHCCLVRNQEEIKINISHTLNQARVNTSTWSRIQKASITVLLYKSVRYSFVHQTIQDLRVVVFRKFSDSLNHWILFNLINFRLHSRSTQSISVHQNSLWQLSLVSLSIHSQSIHHVPNQNLSSFFSHHVFLDFFALIFDHFFVQFLVCYLSVVLCDVW